MENSRNSPKETDRYAYNLRIQDYVTEQLRKAIRENNITQVQLLEAINSRREERYKYSASNLSNKISSGRITYWETIEIAEILGYEIIWNKKI